MPNQVTLTFAGDADKLARASKDADQALAGVGAASVDAAKGMDRSAAAADDQLDRMAKVGSAVTGTSTAIADAAGAFQALADAQDAGRANAVRIERALNDVRQAQQDYNQALGDGKQATLDATQADIDYEQAKVDARVALDDYNAAVAEFGAGSAEAAQAQVDLKQAEADANQARADGEQALRDSEQALIDAKTATLDLSDANATANPPMFQQWADQVNMYAPLLSALVGVLGLVAAAQWLWNIATMASPVVWIIAGIVALVAAIVLIATQTNWFSDIWEATWDLVVTVASAAWDFIKQIPGWILNAFAFIGEAIVAPFRMGFNAIANLWNNTVGALEWTVPSWVPGIGGLTLGVPNIPTFHDGGRVPGAPGTEMVALLQAGEQVIPAGRAGDSGGGGQVTFAGDTSGALAVVIMQLVRTGQIQFRSGV